MNIYSKIIITERIINSFKPCRLYVKELMGMKYFGKTTRDPYKYTGSGKIWKDRIKKYGKEKIVTLWVSDWFHDPEIIQDYSLNFSRENGIVESDEWANLQAENGINGGRFINPGTPGSGRKSAETKRKKGIPVGGTTESVSKGNRTKAEKGISVTIQLNKPVSRLKANDTCNRLADREIVKQLRELAIRSQKKLGSGWVRKPDHWILANINELQLKCHNVDS